MPNNVRFIENPDNLQNFLVENQNLYGTKSIVVCSNERSNNTLNIDFTVISSSGSNDHGLSGNKSGLKKQKIYESINETLLPLLNEFVRREKPDSERVANFLRNSRSCCRELFYTIFPENIARCLQAWQTGISIEIITNESWIPWELLHDDQCFWGEKFIISRRPKLEGTSRVLIQDNNIREPNVLSVLNVVGGCLGKNAAYATQAQEIFNDLPLYSDVQSEQGMSLDTLSNCLQERMVDVINFTCHGLKNPTRLKIHQTKDLTYNLLLNSVDQLIFKNNCLVFANACNSSTNQNNLTTFFDEGISNFGKAFYKRGINSFIGTLGVIPTDYAISFAKYVYSALCEQHTERSITPNIGYALAIAKAKSRENKNIFWLFYCLYGDPKYSFSSFLRTNVL
jgi:hypothetical protein